MDNLLKDVEGRVTFDQYTVSDFWTGAVDADGRPTLTATVATVKGVPYKLEFNIAANLSAGASDVALEVEFAGQGIGRFVHSGALYGRQEIDLVGTGSSETLTFRMVDAGSPSGGPVIDAGGVVPSYRRTLEIGGEKVDVAAFAPGQANLYQVLNGQLVTFDLETSSYTETEAKNRVPLNAIGMNVEDDLLYGLATAGGTDSRGLSMAAGDLVAIDATGATFRVASTPYNSFIGDFDGKGNLWIFAGDLSWAVIIDVSEIGPDGKPAMVRLDLDRLPGGVSGLADLAYHAPSETFYGVAHHGKNGSSGDLVAVDVSAVARGGEAEVTMTKIAGTLVDGVIRNQIPTSAYGAAMVDGDGNVYVGANNGDHDIDPGTKTTGGIYRVTETEDGKLVLALLSAAPAVGNNDGAMDTRAFDPFLGIDTSSQVLLRAPALTVAIAEDDVVALSSNGLSRTVDLLANDVVSEGGTLSVLSVAGVAFVAGETVTLADGTRLAFNADFTVTVTAPAATGTTETEVAYVIGDGNGVTDTGTLTVIVSPVDGTAGHDTMVRLHRDADGNVIDGEDGPNDVILGWGGNDKIFAGEGDDLVYGGSGNDHIRGERGSDTLYGEDGNDMLDGGEGADHVSGGLGNDVIFVDHAGDTVEDSGGVDTIKSSVSWLLSDDFEHLWLRGSAIEGIGNRKDNMLTGNGHDNVLHGEGGNDRILAGAGDDTVHGGDGNDRIDGNDGDDRLFGGEGNDKIEGGAGADLIEGGAGNDSIGSGSAGDGVDVVIGGTGNDILYGGEGTQHFVFRAGDGVDRMKSFESGIDSLVFEGLVREDLSVTSNASGTVIRYGDGDVLHMSLCFVVEEDLLFV